MLPADKNSEFANINPVYTGNVDLPDMLQAESLIGVDTIDDIMELVWGAYAGQAAGAAAANCALGKKKR